MPALSALAQDGFVPRDTWPFLYDNFQAGAVRTLDGQLIENGNFNISVADGALYYIGGDGVIMKSDMSRVYTAGLGEGVYVNYQGRMYQVLSELDCGNVLLGKEIDVDQQNKASIGYGISSSTASVQGLTINMAGRFDLTNKSIQQIEQNKPEGKVLPIKETTYLQIGIRMIPASRQEVLGVPGVDKKAANAFFKQEKIKWKETASLEKVLVFLKSQLTQN